MTDDLERHEDNLLWALAFMKWYEAKEKRKQEKLQKRRDYLNSDKDYFG